MVVRRGATIAPILSVRKAASLRNEVPRGESMGESGRVRRPGQKLGLATWAQRGLSTYCEMTGSKRCDGYSALWNTLCSTVLEEHT